MSKITSPILLDSTGQETNRILQQISETLLAANTLIDDNSTASNRVWSSNKIVKALTVEEVVEGTNTVTFKAIAATPLDIETTILDAPNTVLLEVSSTVGKESSWSCSIPTAGIYNWSTGILTMLNGTEIQLTSHFITAFDGTSTIKASGVDAIKVKYKTISKQSSGPAIDYEIINGGSAKEEA